MAGINKVILIGNLGADPETRITPGGVSVANISLAVSEVWKDQSGQRQEHTEWVSVVAFRRLADLIGEHLRKGARVYIEGKLQTRSWDDKQTGAKRYATEVIAEELQFLDRRPGGAGESDHRGEGEQAQRPPRRRSHEAGRTEVDDDLPF